MMQIKEQSIARHRHLVHPVRVESKNILIMTATFPPRGGSGIQRVYYQADCFARLGAKVWVVTEGAESTWVNDEFELQYLGADRVHRIPQYSHTVTKWGLKLISRLLGTTIYPDSHSAWIWGSFRKASKLVKQQSINTIFVSFGLPSALIVGGLLKRRYPHLQIVIDVRDLWVNNPMPFSHVRPKGVLARLDRHIEQYAMKYADLILAVSDGIAEEIQQRYFTPSDTRVHVVQNGFDEELFRSCQSDYVHTRSSQQITFRHIGFAGPSQHIDKFFQAVCRIKNESTDSLKNVKIEFIGGAQAFIDQLAIKFGVSDIVHTRPYVSHLQAIELMRSADVLLLFWGPGEGTIGGKTYEYLRANRFILAFDQENRDGRKLLKESGRGRWVSSHNVTAQVQEIQSLLMALREGDNLLQEPLPDISVYSRLNQNRALLNLIQSL